MATAFDKPVENKLIDTYVPLPFQEMMHHATLLRDTYDKNLESLDAGKATLANIEAVGPAAQQELSNIQSQYEEFATQQAAGDLTSYDAKNKIRSTVSSLASNPTLKAIASNTAAIREAQKRHQAMAQNPNYKPYYAQDFSEAMDRYSKEGTKSGIDFNSINFFNPVNVREEIERKYFDDIKPDAEIGLNGEYIIKNKGITAEKIARSADANISGYLNNRQVQLDLKNAISTPDGQENVKATYYANLMNLKNEGVSQYKDMSPEDIAKLSETTPLEVQYAKNRLLGAGKEFVFKENDISANQVEIHKKDRALQLQIAREKANEQHSELYNTRTANAYNQNTQELSKHINKGTANTTTLDTYGKTMVYTSIPKNRAEEAYKFAFHSPNDTYDKRDIIGNHSIKTADGKNTIIPNGEILAILPKGSMRFGQTGDGKYAAQGVSYAAVSKATWDKYSKYYSTAERDEHGKVIKINKPEESEYLYNPGITQITGSIGEDNSVIQEKIKAGQLYMIPVISESIIEDSQIRENMRMDLNQTNKRAAESD